MVIGFVKFLKYCGLKLVSVTVLYNSCVVFTIFNFFFRVDVLTVRCTVDHYCTFTLEIDILGSVLFIAL